MKYSEYTKEFCQIKPNTNYEAYSLVKLLPLGIYLEKRIGLNKKICINKHLRCYLLELSGKNDVNQQLLIHNAFRIIYGIFGLILSTLCLLIYGHLDLATIFFGVGICITLFIAPDVEIMNSVKRRRNSIRRGFPEFMNKMVLLLSTGIPTIVAWEKIACGRGKESPLYREIYVCLTEIQSGKPIVQAYESFAKKCRTAEANKFITAILQNIRKGNAELLPILRIQSTECWENRKAEVKRAGEEASTKMILPLVIILIAVFIIAVAPAVISIKNYGLG